MANTKSAKKAARQTIRRTNANKGRRSRMRSYARKVEEAIAAGDKAAAERGRASLGAHRAAGARASQDRLAQGFAARQARQRHAGRLTKKSTTVAVE